MAFYGSKIKTLLIPNSVSDLHNSAFYGMPNIEEMIFQCNLRKISNVAVSVGTLKRLVYMRKEEVKSNILGSTNVSRIITCSQYSSATFSGKEITDKIGICFTPKIITSKCKQHNARTHLFIYVSLIYS